MFSYSTKWLAYTKRSPQGTAAYIYPVVPRASEVEVSPQQIQATGWRLLAVSDLGRMAFFTGRKSIKILDEKGEVVDSVYDKMLSFHSVYGVSACFVPWPVKGSSWCYRVAEVGGETLVYALAKNIQAVAGNMFLLREDYLDRIVDLETQEEEEMESASSAAYNPDLGVIIASKHSVIALAWGKGAGIGIHLFSLPHPIKRIAINGNLLGVCSPSGMAYIADIGGEKVRVSEIASGVLDIGWQGDTLVLLRGGARMTLAFYHRDKLIDALRG